MRRFAASLAEETGRQGGEGERGVARRARARARGRGVQENPSEFGIELSSLRSSQVASAQRRRQAEVRGSEWEREDLGQGERRQVGGTSSHLNDGMRDDKGRRRHSSASLTRHTARRDLIDDRVYDKTSSFESDAGAPSVSLCSSSSSSFFRVGERSQKPMKMMHQQTGGNRQQQQPGQGKEGPRGASRGRAEGGEQSSDSWSEVEVEKREREGEKQERIEEQHHLRTRPLYGNSKRKDGGGRKSATKRFFLLGDSEGEAAASLSTSSRLSERGNTEREGGGAIQLGRLQRGLRTSSFENVSENEMGKVREKFEADREKETAWKNEDREKGLEQNFPEKGTGEIWREHSDFCDEKKKDRHISVEWKHERGTGEGRSIPAKVAA
uniref:Uncharacterized protein n=1 Tax=Chromera velia CCMP2878 TaxID=1169474 RepID=A0A0G4HV98_9ALVE|eukprot:Cvel_8815.t1-p1 / transcript=Cvel_8815.t1 / gene=Cvel_8815 / organism=Chromera_velia_CCMP2878 / gene_product=hypothetical protein / transcript_product=hypothetical protein / location=Cvel_scaffold494:18681-20278(+) / protein_length=382 / sequence_SO=supercontig / SO=protein_coding / is_pseudo=false